MAQPRSIDQRLAMLDLLLGRAIDVHISQKVASPSSPQKPDQQSELLIVEPVVRHRACARS